MDSVESRPDSPSATQSWLARFERMGVRARPLRGGHTVIATFELSEQRFPGFDQPLHIPQVMVATVGRDRFKCVKPEALFALPLINASGCHTTTALEVRVRTAWTQHMEELGRTLEQLRSVDIPCDTKDADSVICIPIEGEGPGVAARLVDARHLILPSRGPLTGIPLESREDRLLPLEAGIDSSTELQFAISNRLETLKERSEERAHESRQVAMRSGSVIEAPRIGVRTHRVLLVGPRLSRDRGAMDSLGMRGYAVVTARSATEAIRLFHRCSPELVLTDADLGRGEGLDLVLMLRDLAGVEEVPVIVVDSTRHDGRRRAARAIGAAGYLVHPLDVARIADRLAYMVDEPRRRRFTRYREPVAVRVMGARSPCTATALSRGGLYLCSDENFPAQTLHPCEIVLPETGRAVNVDVEVLYRLGNGGRTQRGVGLRFERFGGDGEPLFVEFLEGLESS